MKKFLLTLLIILAVPATATYAAPITFYFLGSIDTIYDPLSQLNGSIAVGTPFQGRYTFNPNAVDSNASTTLAQYRSIGAEYEYVATVGGMTFTRNGAVGPSGIEIVVGDNNAGLDVYDVLDAPGSLTNGPNFSTIDEIRSAIYLRDGDQTAFDSTALPVAPPSLAPFNDSASSSNLNVNHFEIRAILRNRSFLFIVSGSVAHIAVPEPSPCSHLICGLIAVVIGYARRRKK